MEIARAEAARRGWPWLEPIWVQERLREYVFWTNGHMRGGNVVIQVRTDTGQVTSASVTPR